MMDIIISNKPAIAFDLDGTLIDIKERDYKVYSDILKNNTFKPLNIAEYWNLRRKHTNIFEILEQSSDSESFGQYFLVQRNLLIESNEYLTLDKLFKHARKTILYVRSVYNCIMVTRRKNETDTINQIFRLGIKDLFKYSIIVQGDKIDAFKSIENLRYVVGDTENDIIPANNLNLKSVAVTTGIRDYSFLKTCGPSYIISSLEKLLEIVL
jgi:phosphoglycolate phosphatase-like HAD superfamily hydrolase